MTNKRWIVKNKKWLVPLFVVVAFLLGMGQARAQAINPTGGNFNETLWLDCGSSPNDKANNLTFTATSMTYDTGHHGNGGCIFDGAAGYLSRADNDIYDFTANYTMTFWIKLDALTTQQYVWYKDSGGGVLNSFMDVNGVLRVYNNPSGLESSSLAASTGVWQFWAIVYNGTVNWYRNGVVDSTRGNFGAAAGNTAAAQIGLRAGCGVGTCYLDGTMSDLRYYNYSHNVTMIGWVNNSGNGCNLSMGAIIAAGGCAPEPPPPVAPSVASLTINASDHFEGSRIMNFSVNVSNGTFSVVNGTVNGGVVIAGIANITNYTVFLTSNFSGGYYNVTTNVSINGSTTAVIRPYQNYVTINITQLYTRAAIGGVNISGGNGTATQTNSSSSQYAVLLMKPGNYSLNFSGAGHFNFSTSINLTAVLTNYTINLSLHDAEFNISLMNLVSNATIATFTLNASPTNITTQIQTFTTTSDTVIARLLKGYNFTFLAIKSGWSISPKNFSLAARTGNLTVFAQESFTINLEIFSESLNKRFNTTPEANEVVTVEVIGPTTQNVTTSNGTLYITNLTGGDYELRYSASSFRKRSYFFNLPVNGSLDIDLFLLNTTLGTQVVLTVVDENDNPLNGSTIKILRFYTSENAFKTVEMSRSNFNGEAPLFVVLNTQEYRFLVERLGVVLFFSSETKITGTTMTIQIVVAGGGFQTSKGLANIYTNLVHTEVGNNDTFTYTFTDTSNFAVGGCLIVTQVQLTGETRLCNVCTTSTAATLQCHLNSSTAQIVAEGIINGTTNQSIVTNTLSTNLANAYATFGNFGPFLALLVMLVIPMVGIFSISVSIILGVLALAATAALGVYTLSLGAVIGLLGSGLLIIIKNQRGD